MPNKKARAKSNPAGSPKEIVAAQRRVIRVAIQVVQRHFRRHTLVTDGKTAWTVDELLNHMRQAANAKIDWPRRAAKKASRER